MGSPDREQVPISAPGQVRSMGRGMGRHHDKGQTAGSTDMHSCGQQIQEDQEVVGFQM